MESLFPSIEEVSLFSDTYSGQNRNQQTVVIMLLFAQDNNNDIKTQLPGKRTLDDGGRQHARSH